jgi:hypothetical protein
VGRKNDVIRQLTEEIGRVRGSLAAAVATGPSGGAAATGGNEDEEDDAAMLAENWMLKAELGRAQEDLAAAEEKRKVSRSNSPALPARTIMRKRGTKSQQIRALTASTKRRSGLHRFCDNESRIEQRLLASRACSGGGQPAAAGNERVAGGLQQNPGMCAHPASSPT